MPRSLIIFRVSTAQGQGHHTERSSRPTTFAEIHAQCEAFAAELGFPCFMFVYRIERPQTEPVQTLLTNYPRMWVERYAAAGYIAIDPVVLGLTSSVQPFAWSDIERSDAGVRAFFADAASYGLGEGFTVPLHGPQGVSMGFSCAGGAGWVADTPQPLGEAWNEGSDWAMDTWNRAFGPGHEP